MRTSRSAMKALLLALTFYSVQPTAAFTAEPPQVTNTGSRITEKNNVYWRFAWQLTFYNPNREALVFDAEIHWIDADDFVINTDRQSRISVGGSSTETFRGSTLIGADVAPNVVGFETDAIIH
jgi:hypothetical protein